MNTPRFPDDWTSCSITLGEIVTTGAMGPSDATSAWVRAQTPRQFPQCGVVLSWAAQRTAQLVGHLMALPQGRIVTAVMMGLVETGAVMCALCDGGQSCVVLLSAPDVPGLCEHCAKAAHARAMELN
jgi:hypothetical protein